MEKTQKDHYVNLLVLLQAFENYWNLHSVSDGELFEQEAKDSAMLMTEQLQIVYQSDQNVYNSKEIFYDLVDDEAYVRSVVSGLNEWAMNSQKYPFNEDNWSSRQRLQGFLMGEKQYLCVTLELNELPIIKSSTDEQYFTKNNFIWNGHLPSEAISRISDEFIDTLSTTDSLVLVADIRKSQDLMTYGPSPEFFRDKILEFTMTAKAIVRKNFGIYDKFTGDGFLCYFNQHLCEIFDEDYCKQLTTCCREIIEYSDKFFSNWVQQIRKLDPKSSGLTLGVDSGLITYANMDSHLFAIGESIVWANRMCSAGEKQEIIVNNIPYHLLKERGFDLAFEQGNSTTKGGESFTFYKMTFPTKV